MKRHLVLPCFFVIFLMQTSSLSARETLKISSAVFPPFTTENYDGFEERLVSEMYDRIGYDVDFRRLSGQRALKMVEQGRIDSTTMRVIGIVKNFKNMIQMTEPMFERDFVVFSKNRNLPIQNWDSLEPYSIAYMNGWKILDYNVKKYQSKKIAKKATQLFQFLVNDRVDLVIFARYSGLQILQNLGITDVYVVGKPLATKGMSLMLNKKHADLVPKLDNTLRAMKQDGSYQKIFDETLGHLIQQ